MADLGRRHPQESCVIDPQGPGCADATGAAEQTTVVAGQVVATTPVSTTAADAVVEVTTIGTNNDGQIWTRIDTIVTEPTVFTTPVMTTGKAIITDSPDIQSGPSTSSTSRSDSLSPGTIAGIAVATFFIGAIIAFIVTWSLFRRRDKKIVQKTCPSGYPIYADSSPEVVLAQKSAALEGSYIQVTQAQMRTPIPVPSRVSASVDPLAGVLPPAASEAEVQNRVSRLFEQIHRHIDTFYRNVRASITPSMSSDMVSFGKDVDMLELLQNCSQPTVALKHALVAFILSITSLKQDDDKQTLWPAELTQMIQANNSDVLQLTAAQKLHRRLSIHLYTQQALILPTRSQSRLSNLSTLSLSRQTSSAIRAAAEQFSLTFFPWANPSLSEQDRENDLTGLITEALEARIWMVGQAAEWNFEWEEPGRMAVVIWPGLVVAEGQGPRRVVLGQRVVGI